MKRGEEHNEERDEEMKNTRQKFYRMQEREMNEGRDEDDESERRDPLSIMIFLSMSRERGDDRGRERASGWTGED